MKKSIILLLLFIVSNVLFARNYLIEQDKNGFNFEMATSKYYSNYMIRSSLGYTLNGRFTLNANFSNVCFIQSDSDLYTSSGADLSYLILKQKQGKTPLNLSLNTSYDFSIHNYDMSHDNFILSKSHIIGIETMVSRKFIFDKNLSMIPSAGIKFANENISYLHLPEDGYFVGPMPTSINLIIYSLQGEFVFKNIYAFCKVDFVANATWDSLFSLYYNTTHLGLGVIIP